MPRHAIAALVAVPLLAACSVFGGKAAEEPPFTLVERDGRFEIRDYDRIAVARTVVEGSYDAAIDEGFGRLFRYISGANRGSAEIAMTAPVVTEDAEGREIAMTAPVIAEDGPSGWAVAFVLPEGMSAASAPAPTDPAVTLADIPARRVAVAGFSGFFTEAAIDEAEDDLARWLSERGLSHRGDWQGAGYNPPWTLPWLRRNEVIVTLD